MTLWTLAQIPTALPTTIKVLEPFKESKLNLLPLPRPPSPQQVPLQVPASTVSIMTLSCVPKVKMMMASVLTTTPLLPWPC